MKKYVWSYKAKIKGCSRPLTGRIEATNGFEAERLVKQENLLIDSVSVKLIRNATASGLVA